MAAGRKRRVFYLHRNRRGQATYVVSKNYFVYLRCELGSERASTRSRGRPAFRAIFYTVQGFLMRGHLKVHANINLIYLDKKGPRWMRG